MIQQFYRQALDKALALLDEKLLITGDGREIIHELEDMLYCYLMAPPKPRASS